MPLFYILKYEKANLRLHSRRGLSLATGFRICSKLLQGQSLAYVQFLFMIYSFVKFMSCR